VNRTSRLQRLLERRWVIVPLAGAIGLVSVFLFSITVERDYWDYWIFPKEKAADYYIYPELRYTIFDVVLLLWCFEGFVTSSLSLWRVLSNHSISARIYRAILIYFILFTALILGGILMLFARSRGL
jgi:hypothetical protein